MENFGFKGLLTWNRVQKRGQMKGEKREKEKKMGIKTKTTVAMAAIIINMEI